MRQGQRQVDKGKEGKTGAPLHGLNSAMPRPALSILCRSLDQHDSKLGGGVQAGGWRITACLQV